MKFRHNIANLQALNFLHNITGNVGILGGTFDPAHFGHLLISLQALKFYKFDYIIWLVANQNPTKPKMKRSIFTRAQEALAIATHPKIIISTAEYDLRCNYSYDSLKELVKRFPSIKFTWIMGIDNAASFRKWHRSNDIKNLCNILVFDRPCKARMINMATLGLNSKASLAKTETNNIIIHRGRLCGLSSTLIKKAG
ncbi:MAG: nicotinate-nucleotide adenylyltransferase [Rickettsiaceae bacterium]